MKRRKPKQHRKEQLVQIRVTAEQKRIMTEAADRVGLDISSWLRQLGLKSCRRTDYDLDQGQLAARVKLARRFQG